jgi:putative inorganic carbon (HCO3(-)) transporter
LLLHDRTIKLKANRTRLLVVAAIIVVCVLLFKTGISKVDSLLTLSTYTQALKSKQPVGPPAKTNTTSSEPTLNNVTDSFDIRKIVWKGAVDIGRSYPLYGTGVETFAYSYYMKRPIEHNATSEWDYLYNKAHNELLNYFANTGFIGFGTYVLLLGYIFYLLIQGVRQTLFGSKKLNDSPFIRILPLGLFSAFTTIFVTNFFGFSTSTVHLFFFIIPGLFLVPSVLHHKEEAKHTNPMFAGAKAIFILLFFLLCMTYLYNYYRADMKYAMADTHMRANEFSSAATVLNEALGIHYEHVYEDKLSFVLANLAYVTAYQQETETASKLRDLSAHYNIRSLRSSPFNVLYWKTKAKNHYLFYQMNQSIEEIEEGIQALQQAEKISPTDPKISYSLAVFYSVLEEAATAPDEIELNRAQALKEINKSIALKDDYTDSYMLKGQLLEKFGKPNEAKAVFEYILQKLDANHREAKTELLDN